MTPDMPETLIAFTLVVIVIEVVPGPNFFLLVKTVPNAGVPAGLCNVAGFASAFLLHGVASTFGLSTMLAASPSAFHALKILGGVYLGWLGLKAIMEARGGDLPLLRSRPVSFVGIGSTEVVRIGAIRPEGAVCTLERASAHMRAFREGFITNLLNPKIALFYLAAFPAFIGVSASVLASMSLVFVHVSVAVLWFSFVTLAFGRLIDSLEGPLVSRWLSWVSGISLLALGVVVSTS